MKVDFKKSFLRDLKRVKDIPLRQLVRETIELVERAQRLQEIKHIKKLRASEHHYRIGIGDYRIGLILEDETLIFVRFLHRKDLYRYFP